MCKYESVQVLAHVHKCASAQLLADRMYFRKCVRAQVPKCASKLSAQILAQLRKCTSTGASVQVRK